MVCSPSAYNTEDDCQYTNSSALKSLTSSAETRTVNGADGRKRNGKVM